MKNVTPAASNEQYVHRDFFLSLPVVVATCAILLCMFSHSFSILDCCMLFFVLVMNYFLELIMNSPNLSTIQKPNCTQFPGLAMTGFVDALRPDNFIGGTIQLVY